MKTTERLLDAPRGTTAEEESVDRWADAGGGGPADTITPFDAALTTASGHGIRDGPHPNRPKVSPASLCCLSHSRDR